MINFLAGTLSWLNYKGNWGNKGILRTDFLSRRLVNIKSILQGKQTAGGTRSFRSVRYQMDLAAPRAMMFLVLQRLFPENSAQ